MIKKLRNKTRIDSMPNDIRVRKQRLGRWIYLSLLFSFFLWITDLLVGPLLRLEADGLVVADNISISVPFPAQIIDVDVTPGAQVAKGDVLARVQSVELTQSIASLTARNAELLAARVDIERRASVADAVLPIARDRAIQADQALIKIRDVRQGGNVSLATWSQALKDRFDANERVAELSAEQQNAEMGLAAVNSALVEASTALDQLRSAYNDGFIRAPVDGLVGLGAAHPGDVLNVGQSIMILYRLEPYVLAYLETGTLYSVLPGAEVRLSNGFVQGVGRVTEVLPVADQLPQEFQKAFQPRGRSQVARIALVDSVTFPLFTKISITGVGWLSPGSMVRRFIETLGKTGHTASATSVSFQVPAKR